MGGVFGALLATIGDLFAGHAVAADGATLLERFPAPSPGSGCHAGDKCVRRRRVGRIFLHAGLDQRRAWTRGFRAGRPGFVLLMAWKVQPILVAAGLAAAGILRVLL